MRRIRSSISKVLVVGGAGYVGGYLVDATITPGRKVRVFDKLVYEDAYLKDFQSVQMRTSTERPQVYDCGGSVKFDPRHSEVTKEQMRAVIGSVSARTGKAWDHGLGDGKASERIAQDIVRRFQNNSWSGHLQDLDNNPFFQRNFGWGRGNLGRP